MTALDTAIATVHALKLHGVYGNDFITAINTAYYGEHDEIASSEATAATQQYIDRYGLETAYAANERCPA